MTYACLANSKYSDETIEKLLDRLRKGDGLLAICRDKKMPTRSTIHEWSAKDEAFARDVYTAREIGFAERAERAMAEVRNSTDPAKARLIFDAERWYLGKLSRAFAEKPAAQIEVNVNDSGASEIFGTFAGALERAARSIAGGATRTIEVADHSEAGSDNP